MTPHHTILLVDDDHGVTELLSAYLARFNLRALCVHSGGAMRRCLATEAVNLVVLDINLPDADGLSLAREIRADHGTPVIMLTARVTTVDHIIGLENGADDYMGKPFEPRELVARIQAVLRRSRSARTGAARATTGAGVVHFDGWHLDCHERQVVTPEGVGVALSNAEFRLLRAFLQTPGKLLSREALMELARGRAMDVSDRSIDLLVSRLRHKLGQGTTSSAPIKTVRGAGYLFNARSVHPRAAGWA